MPTLRVLCEVSHWMKQLEYSRILSNKFSILYVMLFFFRNYNHVTWIYTVKTYIQLKAKWYSMELSIGFQVMPTNSPIPIIYITGHIFPYSLNNHIFLAAKKKFLLKNPKNRIESKFGPVTYIIGNPYVFFSFYLFPSSI